MESSARTAAPHVVIVMGVSGSGKTTIGSGLAAELGWEFADADIFHPKENVAKMAAGQPLTDADREPWLITLRELIAGWRKEGKHGILACSALKKKYRDFLFSNEPHISSDPSVATSSDSGVHSNAIAQDREDVAFVHLVGSYELLHERMLKRTNHYMKSNMLQSQFDTLEPVEPSEGRILTIDVSPSPPEIIDTIRKQLHA